MDDSPNVRCTTKDDNKLTLVMEIEDDETYGVQVKEIKKIVIEMAKALEQLKAEQRIIRTMIEDVGVRVGQLSENQQYGSYWR